MSDYVVKMGKVVSIYDDADGSRIKVRLAQDGKKTVEELPYAFPLLPKMFQVIPKIGEGVFVITSKSGNIESNRYYIGPIISQPQQNNFDPYDDGRGTSLSLLQGGSLSPLEKISNYQETNGAFPKKNDVAIVGRKSEDVILKDGEIDLRCGIRNKSESNNENLVGEVVFNRINPAYIQMKFQRGIGNSSGQEADSVINLVADKVNIISHKDENSFNLTDSDKLIKSEELDDIMKKLHQVPYGDLLVEALEKIRNVLANHVHAYPGLPPCHDHTLMEMLTDNYKEILSKNVRIS